MLDGRVSNGEQVQVDLANPAYRADLDRVATLWKRVMLGWLRTARRGDVFPFRVELGPPGYAILGGDGREISDRWAQQRAMRALVSRLEHAAAGQPHREALDVVVAAVALRHRRAAELAAPDDQRVVEHAALLQVRDQRGATPGRPRAP